MSALRKYHIPGPGALLVLLAFFLPWVSVGCEGLLTVEGSGYNLASGNMFTELDSLLGGSNVPIDPGMFTILWAIPVVAVVALALVLWTMRQPDKERTTAIGHIVAGALGVAALAYIWLQSSSGSESELSALAGELVQFKYGLWLTVAGLLIIVIGGILSFLAARAGAYDYGMTATDGVYQMPVTMPDALAGGTAIGVATSGGDAPIDTRLSTGGQTYSASYGSPDPVGIGTPPRRATEVLQKAEPVNMAWLVMKEGPRAGHSFPLSETTSIGRDTGNDIIIDDTSMSGQHAKVKFEDGKLFTLTDLASTNGSFVFDPQKNNWERIYRLEMSDGMRVKLGRTVLHFMTLAGREVGDNPAAADN